MLPSHHLLSGGGMSAIRGFRGARLTTLSLLLCLVFCAVLAPTVSAFSDGSRSGIDAKIAARLSDEQTDLTLAQIFKDRLGSNTVGSLGKSHYCTCPNAVATSPLICRSIVSQCKTSFCAPICLSSMAWLPRISVDCSRAPTWSWCPDFAKEIAAASTAITSQFQAHTCLSDSLCADPNDPLVADFLATANDNFDSVLKSYALSMGMGGKGVANGKSAASVIASAPALFDSAYDETAGHTENDDDDSDGSNDDFGDLAPWAKLERWQRANRFPQNNNNNNDNKKGPDSAANNGDEFGMPTLSRLPVPSCSARSPVFATQAGRDLICSACSDVVTVSLAQGSCEPAGSAPGILVNPARGSLQDRCLFVRDAMAARAGELLRAFKASVCSCAGCCGDGQCWFENRDAGWGEKAVRTVMERVRGAETKARAAAAGRGRT